MRTMRKNGNPRRAILRRIHAAIAPHMEPLASGGTGFLFTEQSDPDYQYSAEGRAHRSIRSRALPGADDTFYGFTPDGVVFDYFAGNIVVIGWRQLRTGQLRALALVAESEARLEPVRRQREAARETRLLAKVEGPAAARRRESILARARAAGPDGVYLRGELNEQAGTQLTAAGLGTVRRRDHETLSRFIVATPAVESA